MSITISIYLMGAIVILALMTGFWIGRSVKWMMIDTESRIEDMEEKKQDMGRESMESGEWQNRRMRDTGKRVPLGWAISSPVAGTVRSFSEGFGRGALIQPEQGALYAPASGKITRLYPMGNAMLLRTDSGIELMLRVGNSGDELHSGYYRSHVVQNEIVNKGKLLLEFDKEGLKGEGIDVTVSVTVEAAADYRDITVTQREQVKSGEELLWVQENSMLGNCRSVAD